MERKELPAHNPAIWTQDELDHRSYRLPISKVATPIGPICDNCEECVKACHNAYTGRMFDRDEPREAWFDARKSEQYFMDMELQAPNPACGICAYTALAEGTLEK